MVSLSERDRARLASIGRSSRQAAHHVAQKLMSVTPPGFGVTNTSWPRRSCRRSAGTGSRGLTTVNWLRPVSKTGGQDEALPCAWLRRSDASPSSAGAASRNVRLDEARSLRRSPSRVNIGPAFELQIDHASDAKGNEAGAGDQRDRYLLLGLRDRL